MIAIYPFSVSDQELAQKNAQWMNELGGCHGHEILCCYDHRCDPLVVEAVGQELIRGFGKVYRLIGEAAIDGWPQGANYMFRITAAWLQNKSQYPYFLWLEPDAIPMSPGWMDALEAEYKRGGRPFMGEKVDLRDKGRPDVPIHMSGVGVYENPVYMRAGEAYRAAEVAWDIAAKDQIVPNAHFTKLIQHSWHHGTFTHLNEIRTETVLFHSSKDGSLIDVLRGGVPVAHHAHNVEAVGSIPTPATPKSYAFLPATDPIKKLRDGTWVLENDATSGKVIETGRLDFDPLIPHILPLIRPGDTVVDVGAFIGDHTIAYSHAVGPTGKVIAFEPALSAFNCLIHNTEKCGNVFTFNQALGNHIGTAGMAADYPANVASHYIHGDGIIQVRKLDDHLSLLDRLDLIKIDVEGYEVNVLKGAEQIINRFHPKMVIEINEIALKRQGVTPEDIADFLKGHGYGEVSVLYRHGDTVPYHDILALPAAKPPEDVGSAPAHGTRPTVTQAASVAPVAPLTRDNIKSYIHDLKTFASESKSNRMIVSQHLRYAGLTPKRDYHPIARVTKKHAPINKTKSPSPDRERRPVAEEYTA